MNNEFVNIENLSVGYDGTAIIRDICLHIKKGEIAVLIGPNGSGKTTILKSVIRQLAPLKGIVFLKGTDMSAYKSSELAKEIASVHPGHVPAELMTVRDVVSMGRYPYTGTLGLLSDEDKDIVNNCMVQLHVNETADKYFSRLSDGQRQRVVLARALAQEPELLVLDEPTTFLDIRYQLELVDILRKLATEKQLTVILSLHELGLAKQLADYVICVREDRTVVHGTPDEIFIPERIDELFNLEKGAYRSYLSGNSYSAGKEQHYIVSDGKKLRCGFTTGTCAALAAQACTVYLTTGIWPESVSIRTPKGWDVRVSPEECSVSGSVASCAVRKDAGDDADRTDGILIFAAAELTDNHEIVIDGGDGIGRVTKPGLDQAVGAAAINSVPRQMIRDAVKNVLESAGGKGGAKITISAPAGKEIAAHTFNPMLGIEGGISILGTSGVVEPMSMQALVSTIEISLRQAREEGNDTVVLTPGNYGLDYLRTNNIPPYGIPVVEISNFIGEAMDLCAVMGFTSVLIVGHAGKLVKIAGGIMNTHSKTADCRTELFCTHAALCGAGTGLCRKLYECATTDACIDELKKAGIEKPVMKSLTDSIQTHLDRRADGRYRIGALLFSNVYGELGRTVTAERIINEWKKYGNGSR